ncbi:MAG: beta-N-acetylglucosaminidase [Bacteroidetes bacterium]|nr:beta-N-acetylglucosaminidase [Bacteroidota bacterium]
MQPRAVKIVVSLVIGVVALLMFRSCSSSEAYEAPAGIADGPALAPQSPPRLSQEAWVDSVLTTMTLEEKVGQLFMVATTGHYSAADGEEMVQMRSLVADRRIGGVVLTQSDVYEAAMLLNALQAEARVPLLVGGDFERGMAMRVRRATVFPDAMAIAATRDPDLAYQAGYATAQEARAIGVHQNFAPVADVNTNPLNPVINTRSFSDNGWLVGVMVSAYLRGTNDGGVVSTVKHFPGHGDTRTDSHMELPVLPFDRARLDTMELAPFRGAIEAGVKSVMIAHLAVPAVGRSSSVPTSLLPEAIDTLLRRDLGFKGLVVTDAMEMRGVMRGFSTALSAVMAVKAGADVILMPADEETAYAAVVRAARSGEIPEPRLDESVRRILAAKYWVGLDHQRAVPLDSIPSRVATRRHRALARDIARRAVTLVRNENQIIPLVERTEGRVAVLVLTDSDDNRTDIHRPGPRYTTESPGSYFVQQLQRRIGAVQTRRLTPASSKADLEAAIVRVQLPERLESFAADLAKAGTPVVVVLMGNPYALQSFDAFPAVLCAYGDAEPLMEASVEALMGEIDVSGKLPVRVSDQYVMGAGLSIPQSTLRLADRSTAERDAEAFRAVEEIVRAAIADSAFPAAQVAVVHRSVLLYNTAFGTYTYDPASRDIDLTTMFDLASCSKVVGATTAVMKLYDQGLINVDDPVSKYLPAFAEGEKAAITIRHLLTHRAGFPPFRQFWKFCSTPEAMIDSAFATPLVSHPGDSTIYSDIGFITLGKVVERVSGVSLDAFLQREFFGPLGLRSTMYNPPSSLVDQIAPTEVDTSWRKRLVRGEVHDENADFLGGVSGHAGLFSTSKDLAVLMTMLMEKGMYGGRRYLNAGTIDLFTRNPAPGCRLLGWDVKSPTGSSAGGAFGPSSFGHTGFTGTSIWVDPERELCVIFLTNRVHPTRANTKISRVRPAVHDAVVSAVQ